MATPTEGLVLHILRDIQGTLAEHGRKLDVHSRESEKLRSGQSKIRKSLVMAIGVSAHANVRKDLMEDRLGRIERQITEVEEIKARVQRLETEKA